MNSRREMSAASYHLPFHCSLDPARSALRSLLQSAVASHTNSQSSAASLSYASYPWRSFRVHTQLRLGSASRGLNVATRILGLLLAAMAVQTMAEGLKELLPGLVG